jgi:hypothetical protein
MIRLGILAAAVAVTLAGCSGGNDVTAKLVAKCKADGQADADCQCMAEKLVASAGADTVGKMLAAEEAASAGQTPTYEPTPEEAMKVITATMQVAQTCNIGSL